MVSQGSDNIYRTIIVGAGSSSANFIPEFCRVQSENVRVTFIDHDLDQIDGFERQMAGLISPDAYNTVHLNKPEVAGSRFRNKFEELGFSYDRIDWDAESAPDTPPVIRILTQIQWDDIRRAIDYHIQKNPDGTPTAENRIIYVFGVTGMTSSTVAVEVSYMYKRRLIDWSRDLAAFRAREIIQIGLALMSPTPRLGISAYNIEQGYKVCSMLSDMMPGDDASAQERASFPFENLFLIDGSGFGSEEQQDSDDGWQGDNAGRQDQSEFSEWSAETLAALLYPRGGSEEASIDTKEILGELRGFRSLALGRTGWSRDEIIAVHDQVALDDFLERGVETPEDISRVLEQLQGAEEDVTRELNILKDALAEEREAKEELDKFNSSISRFIRKGLDKENRYNECQKNTERTLDDLDGMVHKRAEKLDLQFKSRRLKFLWSTPTLDETIRLVKGQRPGSVLSNFGSLVSAEQQAFRSERDSTLRRMVDPATRHQTKTKSIKSWEIGPPAIRQLLQFPKEDFEAAIMENRTRVEVAEYDLTGDMLYSMVFWIPTDGRMMPRFYRNQQNPERNRLPEGKDAWPDRPARGSTGDDVENRLKSGDLS